MREEGRGKDDGVGGNVAFPEQSKAERDICQSVCQSQMRCYAHQSRYPRLKSGLQTLLRYGNLTFDAATTALVKYSIILKTAPCLP